MSETEIPEEIRVQMSNNPVEDSREASDYPNAEEWETMLGATSNIGPLHAILLELQRNGNKPLRYPARLEVMKDLPRQPHGESLRGVFRILAKENGWPFRLSMKEGLHIVRKPESEKTEI